mgnify:CR=1 FL=1
MSSGSFCFYAEKGSKKYFVVNYGKELKNRVKAALSMMGMCSAEYRLPMCPPSNKTQYLLYDTLREFDLVE